MNSTQRCFKIIHVNIRGLRSNHTNLQQYLTHENYPDVVTINETKLGVSTDISSLAFPNYFIAARREPTQNGGKHGSLILVKNNMTEINEISELRHIQEEVIGVKVKTKCNTVFNVITYYNPPGTYVNDHIFRACRRLRGKTIITGDLNCKNVSWGSTTTDRLGENLQSVLIDNRFHILNNGEKTRYDPANGKEQSLDIIVCNGKSTGRFTNFEVGHDVGSDHFPLKAEFYIGRCHVDAEQYRNIKNTDWTKFREELHGLSLEKPRTGNEIENFLSNLNAAIKNAFENSCPLKRKIQKTGMPFTDEMLKIVREKRKLRRHKSEAIRQGNNLAAIELQHAMNRKNHELKKLQKVRRREILKMECEMLNKEKDPARFFRLYGHITNTNKKEERNFKVIKNDQGCSAETDQEKANLFVGHLENTHRLSDYRGFDDKWREKIEEYVTERPEVFSVNATREYIERENGDDEPLQLEITDDEVIEQ